MVKIRLTRGGTVKRPIYRIVVADSRRAQKGKFLEVVGSYDPMNLSISKHSEQKLAKGIVNLKTDRIQHWISKGAQVSPTVKKILLRAKLSPTAKAA